MPRRFRWNCGLGQDTVRRTTQLLGWRNVRRVINDRKIRTTLRGCAHMADMLLVCAIEAVLAYYYYAVMSGFNRPVQEKHFLDCTADVVRYQAYSV